MSNVFGSPIYLYSADDPSNSGKKDDKSTSVSGRLQEALKAVKPLDSARAALQKAMDSLDGTAYEDIKKGIAACLQHVEKAEKQVVEQLGGVEGVAQAAQQVVSPGVPTAGQISGAEPLPGE